jgi:hypothetical protein
MPADKTTGSRRRLFPCICGCGRRFGIENTSHMLADEIATVAAVIRRDPAIKRAEKALANG